MPDLIWALLFVTAVGLGPFPGALALAVHSIGMLGRLFAEIIEDMDMGPVEALTLTGAGRVQVFSQAVVPSLLPSLLGIALYRFDENLRSSLRLGFCRRRRPRLPDADRDELVSIPERLDTVDRHLPAGHRRRTHIGRAPPQHSVTDPRPWLAVPAS